jgi:hypothetical protein
MDRKQKNENISGPDAFDFSKTCGTLAAVHGSENFNFITSYSVNDQVFSQDNVSVHLTFCLKMLAFGVD